MVNPIENAQFSHDFQKFVLQDPSNIPMGPVGIPKTPFSLKKTEKNKKDVKKERPPWLGKSKNTNSDDSEPT